MNGTEDAALLHATIQQLLLPYGLGAKGDQVSSSCVYPDRPLHLLLIATGSVASIKIPLIVASFLEYEAVQVQVVPTASALHFFDKDALEQTSDGRTKVWTDDEEWKGWSEMGDPILHIELRRWADIVLIAPCSANTLAKLNHGICDNVATSILRALPPFVPVYLFPAMNTHMYTHPLTAIQLKFVTDVLGYIFVGPISKLLACGDQGLGAMLEWSEIVALVADRYQLKLRSSS